MNSIPLKNLALALRGRLPGRQTRKDSIEIAENKKLLFLSFKLKRMQQGFNYWVFDIFRFLEYDY